MYKRQQYGINQFVGIVDYIDYHRAGSRDFTRENIGALVNYYLVLGARTAGIGDSECRVPGQYGDELSIDRVGLHEGPPISHEVSTNTAVLNAVARSRVEASLTKETITDVSFTRSPREDRIAIFMSDPFGYLERRWSTVGDSQARSYGGVNAADYIANMMRDELGEGVRIDERVRDKTLRAEGVDWSPAPHEGSAVNYNAEYPRARLMQIFTDAAVLGRIGPRYWIGARDSILYMTTIAKHTQPVSYTHLTLPTICSV